ncbi:MAG: YfhO family protein, partial [Anaerolineae bacterium]
PLLANHQSATFYPLNLIYFVMPVEQAMGYSVMLHLIMAGLFAYAWGQTIGLSRLGAIILGISFMSSGFFVSRTQFITIINSAAWLPLLFLLADRLARRRSLPDAVWLGVALALQFLAGHAQLWFYSLWAVIAYGLARAWAMRWRRFGENDSAPTGQQFNNQKRGLSYVLSQWRSTVQSERPVAVLLACAVVVALCLSALQLLPTAELALHSQRAGGLNPMEAMTYSFWPWRLLTLAIPGLFGSPAAGDYWGYATYWEDTGYVGVLPLLLALSAVWGWGQRQLSALNQVRFPFTNQKSREARPSEPHTRVISLRHEDFLIPFFTLLSILSLILAMGHNTPIYPLIFRYVPGFGAFRAPARFLLFYTLGVTTLAGIGADRFRLTYRTQYVTRLTAAGAGAMLAISLAAWQISDKIDFAIKPTFAPSIARFALWLGLSVILLLVRGREPNDTDSRIARSPIPLEIWRGLVVGLISIDLVLFAAPLTPTIDPALYRTKTNAERFLLSRTEENRLFATYDYDYNTKFNGYLNFSKWGSSNLAHWLAFRETLVPNLNVFSHTASANNDDPLVVGRWGELMVAVRAADWPTRLRVLRMMNVGYVLAENAPPGLSPVPDVPHLYRIVEPLPRAWLVSQAHVLPAPDALLSELLNPAFDPTTEVLLEETEHPYSPVPTSGLVPPVSISLHEGWNSRTIDLVVPQPGYLVLAYTHYPGWRATVDGQPAQILRANYVFMALPLEPGRHQVILRYQPFSWKLGALVSGMAVLLVIGTAMVPKILKSAT